MTIEHSTAEPPSALGLIVRLIGLLIALLVLPVLIVLNLLLYVVILPAAVQVIFG